MTRAWVLCSLIAILRGAARAETFTIDPARSVISFKVKGPIGKVHGKFDRFEGQFTYESGQPQLWTTTATIETASITTGLHKRDGDLRKADFLDVRTFPTMIFFSTSAAQQSPGKPRILGNLTLHGATHPVALFLERVEAHQDGAGHTGIHAVATTQISRKEFGVGLTHGTFMVGDIIEIRLDIEGVSK